MTDEDIVDRIERQMAEEANRGFGEIPLRRTAALAPFSQAQMDAARNLLEKALRALDVDDEVRARRLVERAVALPYDEHEEMHPAAMMASQQMYEVVTDALEEGGDEWLGAAAGILHSGEEARYCLRHTLIAVLEVQELSAEEERRVRWLIGKVPERAELTDLDLTPEQLTTAVLDVLDGVIAFVDSYEEILELIDDDE